MRKLPPSNWPPPPQESARCALCGRATPLLTEHHLVPKSRGRRRGTPIHALPTAQLCPACHKFLHVTFSNAQLEGEYHSLSALREHDDVKRFVKWLRTQPATKGVRVR